MTSYQSLLQNPQFKNKFVLESLIKAYTKMSREELWLHLSDPIDEEVLNTVLKGYHAYTEDKKPLEYILGYVKFFDKEFIVNEHTIIPRPETEYMVAAVKNYLTSLPDTQKLSLLDIGTGSGILGISILLTQAQHFNQVILSDISAEALSVAQTNWKRLVPDYTGEVHFLQSNLADFLSNPSFASANQYLLVANLPYIPEETFDTNALENVQKREPRGAFVGGADGLSLYRELFHQLQTSLFSHPQKSCTMFLEMMTRQTELLKAEFGDWLHFEEVETFHFNIRIIKATRK